MSDASFTVLNIDRVQESSTNPRQHFDEKGMAELTESIKTKGIVSPILVRMVNSHYEVVDGARRYRAARAAGLHDVPAIVRTLSDDEALEISVIANLQRKDVHPLDEAEGYAKMLSTKRYDVASLAAKVGKSPSYVYQRLALNTLIPDVKKALWADTITVAHAVLFARLQPEDQKETFESMTQWGGEFWTVSHLRKNIEEEVMCVLDAVGFDKKDPLLVSNAGACTVCPKRSGFNKELFDDITKKDRCSDPKCFRAKVDAHLARIEAQAKANKTKLVRLSADTHTYTKGVVPAASRNWAGDDGWRTSKKGCPSPETGLIAEGKGAGQVLQVCLDKACKICNPQYSPSQRSSSLSAKPVTPAARYKRRMEIWNEKVKQLARANAVTRVLTYIQPEIDRDLIILLIREINRDLESAAAAAGIRVKIDRWRIRSIADYTKLFAKATHTQLTQIFWHLVMQQDLIVDTSVVHDEPVILTILAGHFSKGDVSLEQIHDAAKVELEKVKPKPPKKDPKPAGKKTKKGVKSDE